MSISHERWTTDEFLAVREAEVRTIVPTDLGSIESGVAFHQELGVAQRSDAVMRAARRQGVVVVQPRHGETLIANQIAAMQQLEKAGSDIVSVLSDPYTRQLQFDNANRALEESEQNGRSMVSGYPVVAMGVERTREIVRSVSKPVSVRMASQDARLAKEIYLASGFTYMFMGPVQNLAYEKRATPEELIRNYQYEDRLVAFYEDLGSPVVKELPATLTGTLVPPSIALASSILDAMLAVTQGVRRVVVNYGMFGNLVQDVAALRVLRQLATTRLPELADDLEIYVVAPQFMGDFPHDEAQAYAVILNGSFNAALAGVDEIVPKSLHEAFGVPTIAANVAGVRATRQMANLLGRQELEPSQELYDEMEDIRLTVEAILQQVDQLGDGDIARGTAAVIRSGGLDVPFSPNQYNAGRAVPLRDVDGAIRWLDPGLVPLPPIVRMRHEEKIRARMDRDPGISPYKLMTRDIVGFSKGLSGYAHTEEALRASA